MKYPLLTLAQRECLLVWRQPWQAVLPVLFFLLIVLLFPLTQPVDGPGLRQIAPSVIWVAAVLSHLLALGELFQSDFRDGTLAQWLIQPIPLPALVSVKVGVHWLTTVLPILLISPLLIVLYDLPVATFNVTLLGLLLGTPILSFIGAIAVSLTVSLPRNGILLALLLIPLYIPVIIFATSAVTHQVMGADVEGPLLMLAGLLVLTLTLSPLAIAGALRVGCE